MLRKIIYTKQEPVLTLDLPENLQGKRIEVIAFEIEEDQSVPAVTITDHFDEGVKKWHTLDESESIVLEAIKQHYVSRH